MYGYSVHLLVLQAPEALASELLGISKNLNKKLGQRISCDIIFVNACLSPDNVCEAGSL